MAYNLQLKKFDMRVIKDDSVVVFIGRRNTGKSYLTQDFLYHHRDVPTAVVISGTESANHFYSKMIPPIFIYDEFQPQIVDNFMKRQKKMKKLQEQNSNIDNRAFLIFDDLMDDASSWIKDKNVRKIFIAGRHFAIGFLLLIQYVMGIPPSLRSNVDYVFILRESYISNRRRIYENFAGMFPTFEMFCSVMDSCTENYECLVIHNNSKSNKIEDQVFWYKAEMHDDFRLGPDEVWEYSNQNYVEDSDEEEININTYRSNKKGPKLNVRKL